MKVSGHQIEFSYEAIAAWPYAYWAHQQGLLTETESGPDTECLYWYSPKHTIRTDERSWDNMKEAKDLPNLWIHKPRLDTSKWVPPPLKEHFSKTAITYDKPTVVIANRINVEWERDVINYLSLEALRRLFDLLTPTYQVVYINVRGRPELEDTAKAIDIGDYDMIRAEYPQVKVIHDIIENGSYNETQCRIFAGCKRFITMNGGYAVLASYFGGENIIYSKESKELWPSVNSWYNWYPDLGGSNIKVVNTYDDLYDMVFSKWVRRDPLINILVRCHRREQSLERFYNSLKEQPYKNWRVIASYDDEETWKYLLKYPFQKLSVSPAEEPSTKPDGDEYRGWLAPNLYLNEMMELVDDGYIMFMDDDDYLNKNALGDIANRLKKDQLALWRTKALSGRLIPSDDNFGRIVAGDISGIAFAFHHTHKHLAQWEPWRRGDYRVISSLAKHLTQSWIDSPLTLIGTAMPEKGTKEYIDKKVAENKAVVDRINAQVKAKSLAVKKAQKKAPKPQSPRRRPRVCRCCGKPL